MEHFSLYDETGAVKFEPDVFIEDLSEDNEDTFDVVLKLCIKGGGRKVVQNKAFVKKKDKEEKTYIIVDDGKKHLFDEAFNTCKVITSAGVYDVKSGFTLCTLQELYEMQTLLKKKSDTGNKDTTSNTVKLAQLHSKFAGTQKLQAMRDLFSDLIDKFAGLIDFDIQSKGVDIETIRTQIAVAIALKEEAQKSAVKAPADAQMSG